MMEQEERQQEIAAFIKGYDFMRLGQAIHRGQWQSAAMTIRRMDLQAQKLELTVFGRSFAGLKQAIARKNAQEAKQILATVTARRVQMIESLKGKQ